MTYAYISVKELTVDVLPALTIKPAMLFGLKWDISTWLNQNILVKGAPLHVFNNDAPGGEKEPEPDLDPIEQHTFRTERCNTCVGVFDKVIHGSASTKYCDKTTHAFELCAQVSTMVKTFLQSNGSPVRVIVLVLVTSVLGGGGGVVHAIALAVFIDRIHGSHSLISFIDFMMTIRSLTCFLCSVTLAAARVSGATGLAVSIEPPICPFNKSLG